MSATLHTDVGDIKIELFCEQCPKACENFLALSASGYYNGSLFHRNIKGFIVQTGDPTGTGKGGTSIWGRNFEDELKDELKHNTRGVLSMASNGLNTNGSQFFITYAKQPHLDMKYTIFAKNEHDILQQHIESEPIVGSNNAVTTLLDILGVQQCLTRIYEICPCEKELQSLESKLNIKQVFNSLFKIRVIDGLETLDELEKLPVNPKTFRPLTDTRLSFVTIHANPFAK